MGAHNLANKNQAMCATAYMLQLYKLCCDSLEILSILIG